MQRLIVIKAWQDNLEGKSVAKKGLFVLYAILISLLVIAGGLLWYSMSSNLKVGGVISFGKYEWRVLAMQKGKALIISEMVIENRPYDENEDATWEQCALRKYLNGEFYNRFSADERSRIEVTANTNNDNPWYGISGGEATEDRIFLLSLEEAAKYFGDSGQLTNGPLTTFTGKNTFIDDKYNSARKAVNTNHKPSWWWLRSPGSFDGSASLVLDDGTILLYGFGVDSRTGGVRPALWLNFRQKK